MAARTVPQTKTVEIPMREYLIQKIAASFPSFGGGQRPARHDGNPIARALENREPSFALGVPIPAVVDMILEEANDGQTQPREPNVLRLIDSAPTDGRFLLLFGDSGYVGVPLRCEMGHWNAEKNRWDNHAGNDFEDGGDSPAYWLPYPDGIEF